MANPVVSRVGKRLIPALFALILSAGMLSVAAAESGLAFPGAVGFGTETPGGRGGRILKVTNLNPSGRGSLGDALAAKGPRIVVFEVGGVIDLGGKVLRISEPFVTIAGQTAPSPGITLIRGGVAIATHDVVIRHLRVRAGDAGKPKKSGWEIDSMAAMSASNVVVDHCSLAWGTDENLSASGPRFNGGDTPDDWRKHTSHDITFSNCIIAEGLHDSSHAKGPHSKGSLMHDNARRVSIVANLYASNVERNPLFKGGVQGVVVNNLIDNPGTRAIHYNLLASEWTTHPYVDGEMSVVGNVLQYGPDTKDGVPLVMIRGEGPLQLHLDDNLTRNNEGKSVESYEIATKNDTVGVKTLSMAPVWPRDLHARPAAEVKDFVLTNAGARPWDRDEVDQRIVRQVREGKGKVIDSQEQVGGYPKATMTTRKLKVPTSGIDEWLAGFEQPPK